MSHRIPATLVVGAALLAPLPALAHDDDTAGVPARSTASVTRTITIVEHPDGTMDFAPAALKVKRGETVRFDVTNTGKVRHEFRIDSVAGNAEHRAMMREMPDMKHDEGNSIALAPGATGHLAWTFTHAGSFQYACLIPGHYEAGMHGSVLVER